MSDGVAAEINNGFGADFVEFCNELLIAACTWRVEDDGTIWSDIFGDVFGFSENAVGVGADSVVLHFGKGGIIDLDKRKFVLACNGEANAADAGVEVKNS